MARKFITWVPLYEHRDSTYVKGHGDRTSEQDEKGGTGRAAKALVYSNDRGLLFGRTPSLIHFTSSVPFVLLFVLSPFVLSSLLLPSISFYLSTPRCISTCFFCLFFDWFYSRNALTWHRNHWDPSFGSRWSPSIPPSLYKSPLTIITFRNDTDESADTGTKHWKLIVGWLFSFSFFLFTARSQRSDAMIRSYTRKLKFFVYVNYNPEASHYLYTAVLSQKGVSAIFVKVIAVRWHGSTLSGESCICNKTEDITVLYYISSNTDSNTSLTDVCKIDVWLLNIKSHFSQNHLLTGCVYLN